MARLLAAAVLLLSCAVVRAERARFHLSTNHGTKIQREVQFTTSQVLVEFVRPQSRTAMRELFARFRGDLAKIERRTAAAQSALKPMSAQVRHEYSVVWCGVAMSASVATIESIRALPYVRAVRPDRLMHATQVKPVDFGLDAAQRVNASSLPTRGKGITVAVIDSGIDYNHAALGKGFGPGHKVAGG